MKNTTTYFSYSRIYKLITLVILSISSIFIIGCGSSGTSSSRCPSGTPKIILDNDHYDNDWIPTLIGAMEFDKDCTFDIKAIILEGDDARNRSGLLYSSILKSYNREIPIGINTQDIMRYTATPLAADNPEMDPRYKGSAQNIFDLPQHGLGDTDFVYGIQEDATELICRTLSDLPQGEKIKYIIGGQMYAITNLLKETNKCQGLELARTKLDQIDIFSGWSTNNNGICEMNFSEGVCKDPNFPPVKASTYMWNNMPSEVPIILFNIPAYTRFSNSMGYYIDNKVETAESFLLGVKHPYGTYTKIAIGDYPAVLYAAVGHKWGDLVFSRLVKTCFRYSSVGRLYSEPATCDKNHWYVQTTLGEAEYIDFMDKTIYELIKD